jgi:hypothetical protein
LNCPGGSLPQLCDRCFPRVRKPFKPTPDLPEWIKHKLTDKSWRRWRDEHPSLVAALRAGLEKPEDKKK